MDGREPVVPRRPGARGHRTLPHTADLRVEAWAPTAGDCVAEAVRAMVESFADTSGAAPVGERTCPVAAGSGEDLLVTVLEEVVYRLDAHGEIPLDVEVDADVGTDTGTGASRAAGGGPGPLVRFRMADAGTAREVGAVPKAVSLHDLRLRHDPDGWACGVTLDV
ncbi:MULTISPECIES: archease [unclassified Streptomyces]|uniref:archease n=1 Tax=unclassified Streptomyces TaxID=2593676 RepID=UPI0036F7EF9D